MTRETRVSVFVNFPRDISVEDFEICMNHGILTIKVNDEARCTIECCRVPSSLSLDIPGVPLQPELESPVKLALNEHDLVSTHLSFPKNAPSLSRPVEVVAHLRIQEKAS